jgi:DNA-binding NarL/FixJ family response regulator
MTAARQRARGIAVPAMRYEILIVDDHPLFRAALRSAVTIACPDARFREVDSVSALFDALESNPAFDLLLLDLNLPNAVGFGALAHLRGSHPALPVIVVSAMDDARTVRRAIDYGALGFVSKSADAATLGRSVLAVLRGESAVADPLAEDERRGADPDAGDLAARLADLTAQQFRVFAMVCSGRLNKQIAADLAISEATVKAHVTSILRKLGVSNRTQAVALAGRLAVDAPPAAAR